MSQFHLIIRCRSCGAKNRVRLVSGQRVRIRCGSCGALIPLDRKRVIAGLLAGWLKTFFGVLLPNFLVIVVDWIAAVLGFVFRPLRWLWRRLPEKARRRTAWALIVVVTGLYFFAEGKVQSGALVLLGVLLVLAAAAVLMAARGPRALIELVGRAKNKFMRTCPYCGHRYFGWVRNCPGCGEG